jgi:hypothetical protein
MDVDEEAVALFNREFGCPERQPWEEPSKPATVENTLAFKRAIKRVLKGKATKEEEDSLRNVVKGLNALMKKPETCTRLCEGLADMVVNEQKMEDLEKKMLEMETEELMKARAEVEAQVAFMGRLPVKVRRGRNRLESSNFEDKIKLDCDQPDGPVLLKQDEVNENHPFHRAFNKLYDV